MPLRCDTHGLTAGAPGEAWEEEDEVEIEDLNAAHGVRIPAGKVDHRPEPDAAM